MTWRNAAPSRNLSMATLISSSGSSSVTGCSTGRRPLRHMTSNRGMSRAGTAEPSQLPTIRRPPATNASGEMAAMASPRGSPTVTVVPPGPVTETAVSKADATPAASITRSAPRSSISSGERTSSGPQAIAAARLDSRGSIPGFFLLLIAVDVGGVGRIPPTDDGAGSLPSEGHRLE